MVTDGSTVTTTDYDGNYIYTNNALSQILQPEGYIVPDNGTYMYYFQYKDNLGSNRLTYFDNNGDGTISSSEIAEEDNYYPFGMLQTGYNNVHNGTGSNFKYNGKELQDDAVGSYHLNLYDYGARFYDPAIARWTTIDPLAEKYPNWSPYGYSKSNPINRIDPNGMEDILVKQTKNAKKTNAESTYLYYPTGTFKKASLTSLRNMSVQEIKEKYGNPESEHPGSSLPDNPTKSDKDKTGNATTAEGKYKYEKSTFAYYDKKGKLIHGPALSLSQGDGQGVVSTVYKNYKHNGEKKATKVYVHAGSTDWQRQILHGHPGTLPKGSDACLVTVQFGPTYNKITKTGNVIVVRDHEKQN